MRRGLFCDVVWFFLVCAGILVPLQWARGAESDIGSQAVINPVSAELQRIKILDLETAQRIALVEKPSLAAAQERIRQAKELVTQAASRYWPQLDGSASASRVWLSDTVVAFNRSILDFVRSIDPRLRLRAIDTDNPEDYYRARLKATWIIFNGFARHYSIASARFGESESEQALADARRVILETVARSYHRVQLARENIAIEEANAGFNQQQMEEAQARQRAGTASLSDVLNFEVLVNAARSKVLQAQRDYEVAMIGLAALMGVPDATFPPDLKLAPLAPEAANELVLPKTEPLISYAREHRPDILRFAYLVEQARARIKVAKADFYPAFELFGTADGEHLNDTGMDEADFTYEVGIMMTWNFFSGGLSRAKVREASFRLSEVRKTLDDQMINVSAEVLQAISNLRLAQRELVLERSNVDLALKNREMVEKEYRAGQTSLVRLNEAQRDLTSAQSRLALALAGLRQAWQELYYTTGQILDPSQRSRPLT